MVILRPTHKLHALLPPTGPTSMASDTALGDWYVNRIVVGGQPLLVLVSSTSLLSVLVPARNVRGLPDRLATLVEARLRRCDVEMRAIEAETDAMAPVRIYPTARGPRLGAGHFSGTESTRASAGEVVG